MSNSKRNSTARRWLAGVAAGLWAGATLAMPMPVATYTFDGNLDAEEGGVPSLTAIDPLGLNQFQTENVFGTPQTVYRFDGNSLPVTEQAGLVLDASGLLDADDEYSVEIVFRFDVNGSSWENIFGVSNRQSDNAFYVAPSGELQVWPSALGPDVVVQDEWHHVTLTNDGAGQVIGFLDGVFQFDLASSSMDFSAYAGSNPGRLIHFFADNVAGGGQGEFADGAVALIRLYDEALTAEQVGDLPPDDLPAPGALLLVATGLGCMGFGLRRRRAA